MIFPRGHKTSEFYVMVASAALTGLCDILSMLLADPRIAQYGQASLYIGGVFLAARTLLKMVAYVTGNAEPSAPPAEGPVPVSADEYFQAVRLNQHAVAPLPPATAAPIPVSAGPLNSKHDTSAVSIFPTS